MSSDNVEIIIYKQKSDFLIKSAIFYSLLINKFLNMLSLQIILTVQFLIIKLLYLKISYKQNQDREVN